MSSLPTSSVIPAGKKFCYWVNPSQDPATHDGYVPSIVVENEAGHRPLLGRGVGSAPWVWGKTLKEAEKMCDIANKDHGISEEEALKIVCSSMFASRRGLVET